MLGHGGKHIGSSSIVPYGQSLHINSPFFESLSHVDLSPRHINAPCQGAGLRRNLVGASCKVAMNTPDNCLCCPRCYGQVESIDVNLC